MDNDQPPQEWKRAVTSLAGVGIGLVLSLLALIAFGLIVWGVVQHVETKSRESILPKEPLCQGL